jgi:hypothetical protein
MCVNILRKALIDFPDFSYILFYDVIYAGTGHLIIITVQNQRLICQSSGTLSGNIRLNQSSGLF